MQTNVENQNNKLGDSVLPKIGVNANINLQKQCRPIAYIAPMIMSLLT